MEKNKNQLLNERANLTSELKDVSTAYQESEKRRKNAESALSEAQSRISEDTSRIQDFTSQSDKMKVRLSVVRSSALVVLSQLVYPTFSSSLFLFCAVVRVR